MSMRHYPAADFKIKEEVLVKVEGYKELCEFMTFHGISLDDFARYLGDQTEENAEKMLESSTAISPETYDDTREIERDQARDALIGLTQTFAGNFSKKHRFGIELVEISSDAEGDIDSSFWALCNYVDEEAFELAQWVGWTTYG